MPTCKVPWMSIALSANGNIKPCCIYKGGEFNLDKGDTLDSAWKDMDELRQKFINGEKPDSCTQCWQREATVGHSRRTWYDDKIKDWPDKYELNPPMQLRHMDLNFGNTCNLKCRMCGAWGSTAWFKEEEKLMALDPEFKRSRGPKQPVIIPASYWESKKDMFQYLERIDFKGGEPMMQPGMFDFLGYLVEWGFAPNITIAYTTNGTKTPERLKELWPKFKRVKLIVSVEGGTGKIYEYIRGGDLQTLEALRENIQWFDQFDNLIGSFNSAIQIYNIFDLNNLLEWFRDTVNASDRWHRDPNTFKFDCLVSDPAYLNINIMPIDIIDQKNYKSLNIIRTALTKSSYNEKQWNLFIKFTKELDKMRNTDIREVVPELKEYF